MALIDQYLRARGVVFEIITHDRADTALGEARSLGVAPDAALKTVVLKTAAGQALAVVPATRRLSMPRTRRATVDSHARLATEAELLERFPEFELGAVPPLGALLGVDLFVDPEVMDHEEVVFAAGSQTESIRVRTEDLFAGEAPTVVPISVREETDEPRPAPPSASGGSAVASGTRVGLASEVPPGTVVGAARYAVGNAAGSLFAVSRRCRHLGADLADGSIDDAGCLVCPWHGARYDVETGRMVRGPQGVFARIPGLDAGYRALTRLLPLRRGEVEERNGELFVR